MVWTDFDIETLNRLTNQNESLSEAIENKDDVITGCDDSSLEDL
mgnify:CR=1 FL=1